MQLNPEHFAGLEAIGVEVGWRYCLFVDVMGLYLAAIKMAIALAEAGVPLEFERREAVVAARRNHGRGLTA